ncbi:DNA polymerase III subunit delta' [Enterococcus nangangensis]|uniref:DNA polymerase III subunit delta' n=1 Tax=Enterococcus nangangensis TaxID=2559926 RepID=UPI0010F70231|nr:DNA polymerase III subunit delta' [Enterococcus nangangensis]
MKLETTLASTQPIVFQQLHNSLKHGRLGHAYLFEGPAKSELEQVALFLTQGFFCQNAQDGLPCGLCSNCQRIALKEHPDVLWVEPEGQTLKVEQIRQLQKEFGKSGLETTKRGFIICEADKMSIGAANSLLKFLEEPQMDSLAILTTEVLGKILPTIQSRVQILNLKPQAPQLIAKVLVEEHGLAVEEAKLLSQLTHSVEEAVEFSQNQWFNEASNVLLAWVEKLLQGKTAAFVAVQTQLVPLFKEKEQQALAFDLIFLGIHQGQVATNVKAQIAAIFLQAQQKLQSNVSLQNVLEQGTLKTFSILHVY